ncbi:MAG: ASCH domain-containing protein [Nocardioides sp.]
MPSDPPTDRSSDVEAFWQLARFHARLNSAPTYFGPTTLEVVPPPAWAFGDSAEEGDELLQLVLDGTKTATASALWDYEGESEALPEAGNLSILLDGSGRPRALINTTDVAVVPFDEVDEEHARLEGEGDRSLDHWRAAHERFFGKVSSRGFEPDMPVVLERFEVIYQA